uniref:Uncharacterized protein n=1 Tax=Rhizophora mucronata TaxID=61149 RepID=A0A2P2QJN7_RHIMU
MTIYSFNNSQLSPTGHLPRYLEFNPKR